MTNLSVNRVLSQEGGEKSQKVLALPFTRSSPIRIANVRPSKSSVCLRRKQLTNLSFCIFCEKLARAIPNTEYPVETTFMFYMVTFFTNWQRVFLKIFQHDPSFMEVVVVEQFLEREKKCFSALDLQLTFGWLIRRCFDVSEALSSDRFTEFSSAVSESLKAQRGYSSSPDAKGYLHQRLKEEHAKKNQPRCMATLLKNYFCIYMPNWKEIWDQYDVPLTINVVEAVNSFRQVHANVDCALLLKVFAATKELSY